MVSEPNNVNIEELIAKTHVTAFIDILGWSAITQANINDIFRKVVIAKEEGMKPSFDDDEKQRLDDYAGRLCIARRIDKTINEILLGLRYWMVPKVVPHSANGDSKNFWENQHATFVRVSDSIFIHSTSYSTIAFVVSELLKRGLASGILLRAGLSLGYVEHHDDNCLSHLDCRSHDISLFGTGITTAYKAEISAHGTGVRAFVHDELADILKSDKDVSYDLLDFSYDELKKPIIEFPWWRDQWQIGMTDQQRSNLTAWFHKDVEDLIEKLESSDEFAWNRKDFKGKKVVGDTLEVLSRAIKELETNNPQS